MRLPSHLGASSMTQARSAETGDWIKWRGGPCPVELSTYVDVKLRGDRGKSWVQKYGYPEQAGEFAGWRVDPETPTNSNWMHDGSRIDITAYRIVPASELPA